MSALLMPRERWRRYMSGERCLSDDGGACRAPMPSRRDAERQDDAARAVELMLRIRERAP